MAVAIQNNLTVSKMKECQSAEANWNLENWENVHEFLAAASSCQVQVGRVGIKFFMKPLVKFHKSEHKTVKLDYYSLWAKVESSGKHKLFIRVDSKLEPVYPEGTLEDEKLDGETFAAKLVYDGKNCKLDSDAELMVEEFFIYNGSVTTKMDGSREVLETEDPMHYGYYYESVPDIHINLKVTLFTFQELPDNDEVDEEDQPVQNSSVGVFLKTEDLQNFHDVTLNMKDGNTINAHRLVLAASSPVFFAMFTSEMRESKMLTVNIPDIGSQAMEILLKFVYTQKLEDNWMYFVGELVHAASKYEIPSVLNIIDKKLIDFCTTENALELFKLSKLYSLDISKAELADFIKRHTADVLMELDPN